jgi:hypothetical protein
METGNLLLETYNNDSFEPAPKLASWFQSGPAGEDAIKRESL